MDTTSPNLYLLTPGSLTDTAVKPAPTPPALPAFKRPSNYSLRIERDQGLVPILFRLMNDERLKVLEAIDLVSAERKAAVECIRTVNLALSQAADKGVQLDAGVADLLLERTGQILSVLTPEGEEEKIADPVPPKPTRYRLKRNISRKDLDKVYCSSITVQNKLRICSFKIWPDSPGFAGVFGEAVPAASINHKSRKLRGVRLPLSYIEAVTEWPETEDDDSADHDTPATTTEPTSETTLL